MKTIVKLRVQFINAGGGVAYRGERIGVSAETAKRLIDSGAAVAVSISPGVAKNLADVPELAERTTKPIGAVPVPELVERTTKPIGAVPVPELVERATKPITDTPVLKGAAKLSWLRKRIREYNAEPKGRTIVALTEQLQSLGG